MKKNLLYVLCMSAILCSCNSTNSTSKTESVVPVSPSNSSDSNKPVEEKKETYATIYTTTDTVYVFGYVGAESFDLETIDATAISGGQWTYAADNTNIEIVGGKIGFKSKGLSKITASSESKKYNIVVNVGESKEKQYEYLNTIDYKNYTLQSGNEDTVTADDTSVTLNAMGQSKWTRITYELPKDVNNDYVFEADATFLEVQEQSRWLGMVFRNQETAEEKFPYYQFDIRNNTTLGNGMELTHVYANDTYSYPFKGSDLFGKKYTPTDKIHLKIAFSGYEATAYMNGLKAFDAKLPTNSGGNFGFQSAGAKVKFENVKISFSDAESDKTPRKVIQNINVDTSKVDINMDNLLKPNIIASGTSVNEIKALPESVQQVFIKAKLEDNVLNIYDTSNNKIANSFERFVFMTRGSYIPNIEVSTKEEVDAIVNRFISYGIADYALWSSNVETLRYAHRASSIPRLGYISQASDLSTSERVGKECQLAGANYAYMILVDSNLLTKETVLAFTGRGYGLVADATEAKSGKIIDAALDGCSLILTKCGEQTSREIELLFDVEKFNANSLFQAPYATGHRGAGTNNSNQDYKYGENTISSFKWAFDNGAKAIEIDAHLTADNKLAIIHDGTTGTYSTSNLNVKKSTLEELQAITLTGTTDKIPSLDEVFTTFSDEKYKDKTMVIEIKDNLVDTGIAVIEKAKELNWYGRIVLITFSDSTAEALHKYDPSIPVGYLNTVNRKTKEDYWAATNSFSSRGVGFSSQHATVNEIGIANATARGQLCWLWTFDATTNSVLKKDILAGNKCYTTNYLQAFTNNEYKLTTDALEYSLAVNGSKTFTPKSVTYKGEEKDISNYEIVLISGDATIEGNKITKTSDKEILICLKYKATWKLSDTDSQEFYIYSDLITIK